VAPLAGDALVFAGTNNLASQNDFPAGTNFLGLTFNTGAGAFSISGNGIVLDRSAAGTGTALVGGNITNNDDSTQTIGIPITLSSGNHTFATPTGTVGQINLSGAFSRNTGSTLVFNRVGGNINFTGSGLANDASGILGGWAVMAGTNNWAALDGGGNAAPYTAYTTIATGAVTSGANLNYHYFGDTGNITAATGTTINTLTATIGTARSLTVTGTMKFGSRGSIYRTGASSGNSIMTVTGGTITANGGGELNLLDATTSAANFAATNNNLTIASVIADDGANPVAVNVLGYVNTTGANTYSGGTFVNQGRVQAGNLATFGTGPVNVFPGGSVFFNTGGNWTNNFFVSGIGSTEAGTNNPAGPGALRLGTTTNVTGSLTLQGNTRITSSSSTSTGPVISGRITGTGNLELVPFANNAALLNLSNIGTPNDWTGALSINTINATRSLTVRLGADQQIPDTSDLTLTGANVSTLDLNGFDETIAALNGPAASNHVLTNLAALGSDSILTIGTGNASGDYGGKLQNGVGIGTLSLVKNGSGKQVLRGTPAYTGTTTINGGTLEAVGNFDTTGAITVNSGATFAGNGNVGGNVSVATGATLRGTGVDFGVLALQGSLDLAAGTTLDIDMTPMPVTPAMSVAGAITPAGGAGSVTVNLSGVQPVVGSHQLISYGPAGSLAGTGITALTLGTIPVRFAATLSDNPGAKAIMLNVTASNEFPVWTGKLGSEWSTATLTSPKNWVLNSNPLTATDYLAGDNVVFNDNATGTTTVDISVADVAPASVKFENETKDYTVTGSHGITGASALNKSGAAVTTIATSNSFTGGTIITAGTVQVGNGGTSGSLGSGEVKNDGTLTFNRSDAFTFANLISGSGALLHSGSGTTTLSAANTYGGTTTVTAGTLRSTNNASLGSLTSSVTIGTGGALDIGGNQTGNNQNFQEKPFFISGNGPTGLGALVNIGGATQINAYRQVTLNADASVGGDSRFDIRGGSAPKLDLATHTLRKRGTSQFSVVSGTIQGPGNIIVEEGTFAAEVNTNTLPAGGGSITVEPGAQMQFYQNNPAGGGVSWPITVRENSAFGNAGATVASIPANIILEGNAVQVSFNAAVRSPVSNFPLTLTGVISENGGSYGFTKDGVHVLTLAGVGSSYTGATLVNAGTLVVDGSLTASPVTVASGAILGGGGILGGSVTSNGTVSPALAAVGTLSTGATSFSATGSYVAQINSTTLTADKLAVTGNLQLGGTLTVTDLGAATLTTGNKLVLASYTGALSGAFTNAPDGGNLTIGTNTFAVDYDDVVSGQTSVTLTVAAGTAYDDWATLKGLNGTNNGKLQDPDNDGIKNIIEFGIDGNPLSGANDGKTRLAIADVDPSAAVEKALTLTLPVRTGAGFSGPGDLVSSAIDHVIYKIQGSLNLGDFTSLDVTEVTPALSVDMPILSTGWSYRTFRLPGTPGSPNAKAFLRADVSEAP
jgi:fibronectin-binding autotransporter adhesin